MAKKKGRTDLIEKTLDAEIESQTPSLQKESPSETHEEHAGNERAEHDRHEETQVASSVENEQSYRLKFVGRPYLEEKFPESIKWIDQLAREWVEGGDFESLEIPHPKAKSIVVRGLNKAREKEQELEKRIEPWADKARSKVEEISSRFR